MDNMNLALALGVISFVCAVVGYVYDVSRRSRRQSDDRWENDRRGTPYIGTPSGLLDDEIFDFGTSSLPKGHARTVQRSGHKVLRGTWQRADGTSMGAEEAHIAIVNPGLVPEQVVIDITESGTFWKALDGMHHRFSDLYVFVTGEYDSAGNLLAEKWEFSPPELITALEFVSQRYERDKDFESAHINVFAFKFVRLHPLTPAPVRAPEFDDVIRKLMA